MHLNTGKGLKNRKQKRRLSIQGAVRERLFGTYTSEEPIIAYDQNLQNKTKHQMNPPSIMEIFEEKALPYHLNIMDRCY